MQDQDHQVGLEDQLLRVPILSQKIVQVKGNPDGQTGTEELDNPFEALRKYPRSRIQAEAETAIKVVNAFKLQP